MVRPNDGVDLGLWPVDPAVLLCPVDTHIHRLAGRWGLSDGSSVERTERDLKQLFPESTWIRLHLALILFLRAQQATAPSDPTWKEGRKIPIP